MGADWLLIISSHWLYSDSILWAGYVVQMERR
jgi:hypothetical protein